MRWGLQGDPADRGGCPVRGIRLRAQKGVRNRVDDSRGVGIFQCQ